MQFSHPKPRHQTEPALPMINVVFLLLIFFLMSAQIVTPPPFEVTPPSVENAERDETELRLHISADTTLAFDGSMGDEALEALAAVEHPAEASLLIRADAALPATKLARVLAQLSALGFQDIRLATVPR